MKRGFTQRLTNYEKFLRDGIGPKGKVRRYNEQQYLFVSNVRGNQWSKEQPQYRDNILKYCEDKKYNLTSQQARVVEVLQREKRVLVPSGNGVGKSWLAAVLASWHYDCWNPGITLVTAPNLKQVKDILFKELRNLRKGDPNFLKRAARLQSAPNHFIDGLTANSSDGYQGRHDITVMVIFDEAEDLPKDFWEAAETMAYYFVAIYNPTTTGSECASQERSGHWPIVPLNALEHPNISAGLNNLPPLIPSAVKLNDVRTRLKKWSRIITNEDRLPTDVELEGVIYRPGPAAEARVLGRRPTTSVDTVFSQKLWEKLLNTKHDIQLSHSCQIGVDVARFGDDFTCIHGRKGFCSILHESYNGYDTIAVSRCVEQAAVKIDKVYYKDVPILIDDTGLGGGVTDTLRSWGFNVYPINFGSKGNFPEEYPNIRSEILFGFADVVDKSCADISRLDPSIINELYRQLLAPKYTLDTRGRRVVEPKAVTKSLLGRSPDDLDSICLCYYSAPENLESYE